MTPDEAFRDVHVLDRRPSFWAPVRSHWAHARRAAAWLMLAMTPLLIALHGTFAPGTEL